MLPMLPIFQRTLQLVVLLRPDIKGGLPKGKDRRNMVVVEQGAAVNSWLILYFQLAAAGRPHSVIWATRPQDAHNKTVHPSPPVARLLWPREFPGAPG